jgi:hypothetical protein
MLNLVPLRFKSAVDALISAANKLEQEIRTEEKNKAVTKIKEWFFMYEKVDINIDTLIKSILDE